MVTRTPGAERRNRGPSAAQANRAALVHAAREVFAEGGISAPLYEVARRAGVGQGSLYRHFPDRVSLVIAVFEANVQALEDLAAQPGTILKDILARLTEFAEESSAFLDAIAAGSSDERLSDLGSRVRIILEPALAEAQADGRVARGVTIDEVLLAILMLSGALGRLPSERRHQAASDVWAIVRRAWEPR